MYDVQTHAQGPAGSLPLDDEFLLAAPSGDLFGLTQDAGMGWDPALLRRKEFLILSTQGGVRREDGSPLALGYHTGHWEVGLLVQAAAQEFAALGAIPFAGFVTDPCDGRTQGTAGMMDSLPYRNDAAIVLRRLIRSLPTRAGVMGVATCDKGLPAMMLALAAQRDAARGARARRRDAAAHRRRRCRQSADDRRALCPGRVDAGRGGRAGLPGLRHPRRRLPVPGHRGDKPGRGRGAGAGSAALGPGALGPADLAGHRRAVGARAGGARAQRHDVPGHPDAGCPAQRHGRARGVRREHKPAAPHPRHRPCGGAARPTVDDWAAVNRSVPRLVDVLPNGPVGHPTVRVFLAGGVPEVMLHLAELGLLHLDVRTVEGITLEEQLEGWATSERRARLRARLVAADGVDPDDVILSPARARAKGLTSTVTFPVGNLAPQGSVVKSTAIDPSVVDADGVYRKLGPARVFTSERAAIAAIKGQAPAPIQPGDILVLMGRGPLGCGMEETYQVTSALKHLPWGKEVALITDARFSGVSTGACIGHIGPEALAGGPLGSLRDGDLIRIVVDRVNLAGSVDLVGHGGEVYGPDAGARVLASRSPHPDLAPDPDLPDDTRLWAALQQVSGGIWGGCTYDVEKILTALGLNLEA